MPRGAEGGARVEPPPARPSSRWLATAFAIVAAVFGTAFAVVTPPFQTPDEYNHYYRAFQVSEGRFVAESELGVASGETEPRLLVGGRVPASLSATTDAVSHDLYFHPERKQRIADVVASFRFRLRARHRVFATFPNTALYSPVGYLPQSLAMAIARRLRPPPIALLYVGRLASLAAWIAIATAAIALAPLQRGALFLIALAPMSIFVAASVSSDGFVNATALLFVALVVRASVRDGVGRAGAAALAVTPALLALAKTAYAPLALLLLAIPDGRLGSRARRRVIAAAGIALTAAAVVGWTALTRHLVVPLNPTVPGGTQVPAEQLRFMAAHPGSFLAACLRATRAYADAWLHQMVGILGWLDTPLPDAVVVAELGALVVAALVDGTDASVSLPARTRAVAVVVWVLGVLAVMAGIYVTWTPVAGRFVDGVQGRHLLPLAPVAVLTVQNPWLRVSERRLATALVAFAIAVDLIALAVVVRRYYV